MSWIREVLGYLLIGLSIYGLFLCYFQLYRNNRIIEAVAATVLTIIFLRAGVQLLKVAICSRIAAQKK